MKGGVSDKVAALGLTVALHSALISVVFLFGFAKTNIDEPIIVDAALVEMAKLGDRAPDPKKLVRIDAVPPAPAAEEKAASISRRVKKKKKPKPKKKPKKTAKKKKSGKPKKKKRKKRDLRQFARSIVDDLEDERADEDRQRIGYQDGDRRGRSLNKDALKRSYAFEVSAVLRPHLKVPEVIPRAERAGLKTKVFFKLSRAGQVIGSPKVTESSGNRLFDNEALSAVSQFAVGRSRKLPLPKDKALRAQILRDGIITIMRPNG